MVSANDHKHYCAVCGAELPLMKHNEYLERHCAIRLPTGQQLYYCPGTRHTPEEIEAAIYGRPTWTTGRILKERQRLI
jgi:hypothetical protein